MMTWIIELTQKKPILGLLAALLIGISTMGTVCAYLYKQNSDKDNIIITNERYYAQSKATSDSLHKVEILTIKDKANAEVHDYLTKANADMQKRLDELQQVNTGREVIYNTNKQVVNHNRQIINKLNNAQ